MFLFNREGVGEGMRGASRERALQVIILHTLVMWGSARVPPLCSTINSLGGGGETEGGREGERQGGSGGKRLSQKVGLYSALII